MDASDETTWFVVAINTKSPRIRYEMHRKLIPLLLLLIFFLRNLQMLKADGLFLKKNCRGLLSDIFKRDRWKQMRLDRWKQLRQLRI
jgi:hypothetical protein